MQEFEGENYHLSCALLLGNSQPNVTEVECVCGALKDGNGVPTICRYHTENGVVVKTTERNISFLRQWLNEDRITDPNKMVSNEDIKRWLKD